MKTVKITWNEQGGELYSVLVTYSERAAWSVSRQAV